jgi:hypothetical protein
MTIYLADAHVHDQRLVTVFKMVTMLEECITEEQRCVMRFSLWTKGLNAKDS